MKIIIDSSFLLHTFSLGLNFTACLDAMAISYELFIPRSVITELENLTMKRKKYARLALQVAKKHSMIVESHCTAISVDECVLKTANELKAGAIATTDHELKKKAWQQGLSVLYIRGKSRYELTGPPL
ncbi:MAG: PIN domain-containing protein [Candidatus Odinarchaeota archaeon]